MFKATLHITIIIDSKVLDLTSQSTSSEHLSFKAFKSFKQMQPKQNKNAVWEQPSFSVPHIWSFKSRLVALQTLITDQAVECTARCVLTHNEYTEAA